MKQYIRYILLNEQLELLFVEEGIKKEKSEITNVNQIVLLDQIPNVLPKVGYNIHKSRILRI